MRPTRLASAVVALFALSVVGNGEPASEPMTILVKPFRAIDYRQFSEKERKNLGERFKEGNVCVRVAGERLSPDDRAKGATADSLVRTTTQTGEYCKAVAERERNLAQAEKERDGKIVKAPVDGDQITIPIRLEVEPEILTGDVYDLVNAAKEAGFHNISAKVGAREWPLVRPAKKDAKEEPLEGNKDLVMVIASAKGPGSILLKEGAKELVLSDGVRDERLWQQVKGNLSDRVGAVNETVRENLRKSGKDPSAAATKPEYEAALLAELQRHRLRVRAASAVPIGDVSRALALAREIWKDLFVQMDLCPRNEFDTYTTRAGFAGLALLAPADLGDRAAKGREPEIDLTKDPKEPENTPPGPGVGMPPEKPKVVANAGYAFRLDAATRAKMLEEGGGNALSEAAVAKGLEFLANHQAPDGHWSMHEFNKHAHRRVTKPDGKVALEYKADNSDPRTGRQDDIAGTGFGLLPFLAAGYGMKPAMDDRPDYSGVVRAGVGYLLKVQNKTDGQFSAGLYSHAVATLAICEAAGVTADPAVRASAQQALRYIEYAQDPNGGGWRYTAKQPGDTSVTGWQVSAIRAGLNAGMVMNPVVLKKASAFLDSCGNRGQFSYTPGVGGTPTMSAVGLLCEQNLGVTLRKPSLLAGVPILAKATPAVNENIYYLYYATQVMHHMGGDEWKKWNLGPNGDGKGGVRDALIAKMDTGKTNAGAEGSWVLLGGEGRLMSTSLALLTLQVYYRHQPLHAKEKKE